MRKLFYTAALAVLVLLTGSPTTGIACTNILVSKGATKDGSVFISYNADSHTLYGELYFSPAADYPEGAMRDVIEWDTYKYLGKIKQVRHTYTRVGNINENQVAVGETTYGGREELQAQPGATMDYGSMMYIALERSKTAREAIKVMTDLAAEYGYCSEGESFSISDANEVWIMEMIGKGKDEKGAVWVAMRVPDGYVCAHANEARITTFPLNDPQNCLYSPDVITFAKKKGYFRGDDKDFSFSDTYAPVDFEAARFCEARVWAMFNRINPDMGKYLDYAKGYNLKNRMPLWVKPDHKLDLHEVMGLMRDHFEGTELDMTKDIGAGPFACGVRWRPLTWKVDSVTYFNERATSTQQTGFAFVAQSRSWLPDAIGGIIWFGVDDTYSGVYSPMYCSMTRVPHSFAVGNGDIMTFSETSAFWVFNQVANWAYTRYNVMIPEIQAVQKELETKYISETAEIDKNALELYKKKPAKAVSYLTDYSVKTGDATVTRWKELYAYLFTKYMDGNIKTRDPKSVVPKVSQPGYGPDWYRKIADHTGDRYIEPKPAKH